VVAVDGTAPARVSLTVVHQFADLEPELLDRNVSLWVVASAPATLRMARQTPRWQELREASRLFPTALAAVSAFRKEPSRVPVA
jgi:hypothetical protein